MQRAKNLKRTIFETSRELEYFTEKELRAQIGHDKDNWPICLLRELIDNSLDACENRQINPVIEIDIKDDFIIVQDNGPGIPLEIIRKSQDYLHRISDKAFYVSPTRGQMGNALKTIYAAPFVINPESPGYVEIGSKGELHHISIELDRIAGKPIMTDKVSQFVKNGTFVKIYYPNSTSLLYNYSEYSSYNINPEKLIEGYSAFNPHATFRLNDIICGATNAGWQKWRTDLQTSIHWYNVETLSDLISGYLVKERKNGFYKKTVREFVSEFRGLSSTAKQKKITSDYSRSDLSIFIKNSDIDREAVRTLLEKMKSECIAPKPNILGFIGEEHFKKWIVNNGGSEKTIQYRKKSDFDENGLPYILELGFAVKTDNSLKATQYIGLNWSPVVGSSPDNTLRYALQEARIDNYDPVIFILHITKPRIEFLDRGKTKTEL